MMRAPERIGPMLDAVRKIWEANPDLRLAQLISNASRGHSAWPDVFSVEDQDLMKGLERMMQLSRNTR